LEIDQNEACLGPKRYADIEIVGFVRYRATLEVARPLVQDARRNDEGKPTRLSPPD
jgi:hypothetical protein